MSSGRLPPVKLGTAVSQCAVAIRMATGCAGSVLRMLRKKSSVGWYRRLRSPVMKNEGPPPCGIYMAGMRDIFKKTPMGLHSTWFGRADSAGRPDADSREWIVTRVARLRTASYGYSSMVKTTINDCQQSTMQAVSLVSREHLLNTLQGLRVPLRIARYSLH